MSNGRLCKPLPASLALLLFACLAVFSGRIPLNDQEDPAFVLSAKEGVWVELAEGGGARGFRQFFDETAPLDVIKMTGNLPVNLETYSDPAWIRPLATGQTLIVEKNSREAMRLRRSWMSAANRITLGIPLHPDRMSLADWADLPGIGPKLATRIEQYRQKNGDFGSLEALRAVPGIGPKRISAWQRYF